MRNFQCLKQINIEIYEQAYLDKWNGVKLIVTPTWKHIESKVSNPLVVWNIKEIMTGCLITWL
jgi:hypothetical protein